MGGFFDFLGDVATGVGAIFNPIAGALNFGSQLENQQYMRRQQSAAWEREDTAVQRRAADLKAAGINPLLAAGSAAQASSPVNLSAPQIDANSFGNAAAGILALKQNKQNIAQSAAEIERLKEVTSSQHYENMKAAASDRAWQVVAGKDYNRPGLGFFSQAFTEGKAALKQLDTINSVYDKAVADAEASRTNADALARDFQIAKDRGIPMVNLGGEASQTSDLGHIFEASDKGGFLKGAALKVLQSLFGTASTVAGKTLTK